MTLCFFKSASLVLFFEAWKREKKYLYILSALMCALGVLTKGPVALLVPILIISIFLTLTKSWHTLGRVPWFLVLVLFSAVAVPWFVVESLFHPGFFEYFFIRHNIKRFATSELKHTESVYYYFLVIAAGFFPWSVYLPRAIQKSIHKFRLDPLILLCLVWFLVEVLFFTLARAKVPTYVLSVFLPMSIIVARLWDKSDEKGFHWENRLIIFSSAAGLVAGGIFWLHQFPNFRIHLFEGVGAGALILAVMGWLFIEREKFRKFSLAFCMFFAAYAGFGWALAPVFADMRSLKSFSQAISNQKISPSQVISFQLFKPSLVFYLNQRIENPKSLDDLRLFLGRDEAIYCILREEWWLKIQSEPFARDAVLLASNHGKVLVFRDKRKKG